MVGPTPVQMDDFRDLLGTPYAPVSRIVTVKSRLLAELIPKYFNTSIFYSFAYLPTQDKSLPCLTCVEISLLTIRVTFDHELYGFSKVIGHILSQIMDQEGPDPMSQY